MVEKVEAVCVDCGEGPEQRRKERDSKLEAVRKHPEYLAMLANLTATQARCTELLDQYRTLKRETTDLAYKHWGIGCCHIDTLTDVYGNRICKACGRTMLLDTSRLDVTKLDFNTPRK